MRQRASSGSVKAFWLNKEKILQNLKLASKELIKKFPEIKDVRLFGSLAKNEETGLSDIDIFIIAETHETNPIERIKPYFFFLTNYIEISFDILVGKPEELASFEDILKDSISLIN